MARPFLYAICYEVIRNHKIIETGIDHVKAESIAHARNQFCFQHPNRSTHNIVAVGPALGYFLNDEKNEKSLSAD